MPPSNFQKLLRSSLQATKRAFAWRLEDLSPPPEMTLFDFSKAEHRSPWVALADNRYGGSSQAAIEYPNAVKGEAELKEAKLEEGAHSQSRQDSSHHSFLRFSGTLSTASAADMRRASGDDSEEAHTPTAEGPEAGLGSTKKSPHPQPQSQSQTHPQPQPQSQPPPPSMPMLRRSGFAYMRTLEGDSAASFDLEPYDALVFHARGDGLPIIASIRTDNWVCGPGEPPESTWQTAIAVPAGGHWYRVEVPLSSFVPTWKGRILPTQASMNKQSVVGLGIAACIMKAGSSPYMREAGPFKLDLLSITAVQT